MRDLRTAALECLLFLLALPMLVVGITFGATFLWGGLTLVADEMLIPLFRDSGPYSWMLRVGTIEVLCYGTWWCRKQRTQRRPLRAPTVCIPARPPLPGRAAASRATRAA